MKTTWTALGALAGLGMGILQSNPAAACESDEECGAGYACETYQYPGGCATPQPDCAADDEACLAKVAGEPAVCDEEIYTDSFCRRAACEADADCGDVMVCLEYTTEACAGSAGVTCDPDSNCETQQYTEECTTDVYKECGYRYEGECEADADCGDGFTCVAQEECYCTGGTAPGVGGVPSAGSPVAGGGDVGGSAAGGTTAVGVDTPPETGAAEGSGGAMGFVGSGAATGSGADTGSGAATGSGASSDSGAATGSGGATGTDGGSSAGAAAGSGGTPVTRPGTGPGVGGTTSMPTGEPTSCTCTTSDRKVCQVKELPCESNGDCPAGLACQSYSTGTCSVDATTGSVECTEEVSEGRCQPQEWVGTGSGDLAAGGSGAVVIGGGGTPTGSGAGSTGVAGRADPGSDGTPVVATGGSSGTTQDPPVVTDDEVDPAGPGAAEDDPATEGDDGEATPDDSSDSASGDADENVEEGETDSDSDSDSDSDGDTGTEEGTGGATSQTPTGSHGANKPLPQSDGSGCSVSRQGASPVPTTALFGLAGFALLVGRRRRR